MLHIPFLLPVDFIQHDTGTIYTTATTQVPTQGLGSVWDPFTTNLMTPDTPEGHMGLEQDSGSFLLSGQFVIASSSSYPFYRCGSDPDLDVGH